jgi:hypothetical protein
VLAPTSRTPSDAAGAAAADGPATTSDVPAEPRTVALPRCAGLCAAATGLALLVVVTTADPVRLLHTTSEPATGRPPGPLPTPSATASTLASGTPTPDQVAPYDVPWLRPVVLAVLVVVGLVMLAGTVLAVVQVARRLWEDRWQAPDVPQALADEQLHVDLAATRDAVVESAAELREALLAGSPRNGVVQCWLRLVQALEEHGIVPDPAQSATELTRVALSRLSPDARAVTELTSLFLEARFSEHTIGEPERQRALDALHRVVASLEPHRGAVQPAQGTPGGPA